jgi:hypothetical protein
MVFSILPANTESAAYEIDNSLRFNDGDSPKLTKTFGSAGTSVQTFTISFWIKKCLNGKINDICGVTNGLQFQFKADDTLRINFFTPGEDYTDFVTSQLFRDPSAWYHIVLAVDTTQGTEANRKKLYVNGSQVSSFGTQNFPTQNRNLSWNSTAEHQVGYSAQSNNYADIYLADFNSVDGQALTPSSFGETNDNGVWIPKKYLGSYGDNGFFLEFQGTGTSQNSSGMGADTSGNDNHFAVTNLAATDVTVDTPTNNFATVNSAIRPYSGESLSEGNLKATATHASVSGSFWGTIPLTNGKWYWECKITTLRNAHWIGVSDDLEKAGLGTTTAAARSYGIFYKNNGKKSIDETESNYGNTYAQGDIIGVALDMDNKNIYFSKNGTFQNSGDPTTGASGTGKANSSALEAIVLPACMQDNGDATVTEWNFGNPTFAISSGNADANGYGNFEYAVPSGYYSLCTKNLAEYG